MDNKVRIQKIRKTVAALKKAVAGLSPAKKAEINKHLRALGGHIREVASSAGDGAWIGGKGDAWIGSKSEAWIGDLPDRPDAWIGEEPPTKKPRAKQPKSKRKS